MKYLLARRMEAPVVMLQFLLYLATYQSKFLMNVMPNVSTYDDDGNYITPQTSITYLASETINLTENISGHTTGTGLDNNGNWLRA